MSASDELLLVVSEWVRKAENDLRTATLTLRAERDCPTDTVCFHAQQCVEKYLKALLVLRGSEFAKTHNLLELTSLLPDEWRPDLPPQLMLRFNAYATVTRYPGEYAEISLEEARDAIAATRKVRKVARAVIPASALRKPRARRSK